jgi:hypothetical protein
MDCQKINQKIQKVIDLWSNLDFSKLHSINIKANNITFSILTYEKKSYEFLNDINALILQKHPVGNLSFGGFSSIGGDTGSTILKTYKVKVFDDDKIDEEEYLQKLQIFYENLATLIEKYINDDNSNSTR